MFNRINKTTAIFLIAAGFTLCQNGCGPKQPITYHQNVAPILEKHCISCHHEGGSGPFSLMNYEEVRRKAKTIVRVTGNRFMPPWPADPAYSHFAGENFLSDAEIETIRKWHEQGSAEGNAAEGQSISAAYTSPFGKPDLTLELEPIPLPGDEKDRFFVVKIPGELARDTFIRAIEFVAGSKQVHHVNGHLLNYEFNEKYEVKDGIRFFEREDSLAYENNWNALKLYNDNGTLPQRVHSAFNYLPGVEPAWYPEGIGGFPVKRKFALVCNDLHYGPGAKTITDKSRVNIYFGKKAPERPAYELMLGTNGRSKIEPPLIIPPGKVSTHTTRFQLDADISILTINPHLHLLGKSLKAYAVKPNGDTIPLIRIPRWDFRWQYFYTFKTMQHIPAGSVIVAEATFDNTLNNPLNPNVPPKTVGERYDHGGASMRTTDEMFQFIITWTPYQKGDENISLELKPSISR